MGGPGSGRKKGSGIMKTSSRVTIMNAKKRTKSESKLRKKSRSEYEKPYGTGKR